MLMLAAFYPVYYLYIFLFALLILCTVVCYFAAQSIYKNIFLKNQNPSRIKKACQSKGVDRHKRELKKQKLKNEGNFFIRAVKIQTISMDGLKLNAYFYDAGSDITVICVPGYGAESRKAYGLHQYVYKNLGYNVLSVDARSTGNSEGDFASFGYFEQLDLMRWINTVTEMKGKDSRIILAGVSMGANTTLLVANRIPSQVIGIIADSGYTSAYDQFDYMLKRRFAMIKPLRIITLGFLNRITLKNKKFSITRYKATEVLKKSRCPVCFITSVKDSVVSSRFSKRNYDACSSGKEIHLIPNSDHLLTCYVNEENYTAIVREFINSCQKE